MCIGTLRVAIFAAILGLVAVGASVTGCGGEVPEETRARTQAASGPISGGLSEELKTSLQALIEFGREHYDSSTNARDFYHVHILSDRSGREFMLGHFHEWDGRRNGNNHSAICVVGETQCRDPLRSEAQPPPVQQSPEETPHLRSEAQTPPLQRSPEETLPLPSESLDPAILEQLQRLQLQLLQQQLYRQQLQQQLYQRLQQQLQQQLQLLEDHTGRLESELRGVTPADLNMRLIYDIVFVSMGTAPPFGHEDDELVDQVFLGDGWYDVYSP